jgi:hypothetical protein
VSASTHLGRAGVVAALGLAGITAAPAADLRTDLDALGLALDRAVLQVSRPLRGAARSGARGYRLEGFGAMFVMAPRALPVPPPTPTPEEREIASALADAVRDLESRLPRVASDDLRLQLQQSLIAMRKSEEQLRLRDKMGRRAAGEPVAVEGTAMTPPRTLEETLMELERDVQMQLRLQAEAVQDARHDFPGIPPELRRQLEAQMDQVNAQAEAFAVQAERARQEAERVIWNRLGQQPPPTPATPTAPATVAAPAAPGTPGQPNPFPSEFPGLAVLPPWQLRIDPMDDPTPDPRSTIQGVGDAVTAVLEQAGARLTALGPQEMVAVAIDFVPATRFGARPQPARTLTVRAKKADIDQRAAGQLSPAEFRQRVELVEY